MAKFIIQGKADSAQKNIIPAQDFGYSVIDSIEYANWYSREELHTYTLHPPGAKPPMAENSIVPVGSVEFCQQVYGKQIKPLNIPQSLWEYAGHEVGEGSLWGLSGDYFVKSKQTIKSEINGEYRLPTEFMQGEYFYSKILDCVESEWRCFVLDGEVLGVRCYSGNEWIMPSKNFVKKIAKKYTDKRAYTLDIMVDDVGKNHIVELHNFFGCGLYGFDHRKLLTMLAVAHREINQPDA